MPRQKQRQTTARKKKDAEAIAAEADRRDRLRQGIESVLSGKYTLSQAASVFGVGRSTISDHINNTVGSSNQGRQSVFTAAEEKLICEYAERMEVWGWGITNKELRKAAADIVENDPRRNSFTDGMPGQNCFPNT